MANAPRGWMRRPCAGKARVRAGGTLDRVATAARHHARPTLRRGCAEWRSPKRPVFRERLVTIAWTGSLAGRCPRPSRATNPFVAAPWRANAIGSGTGPQA